MHALLEELLLLCCFCDLKGLVVVAAATASVVEAVPHVPQLPHTSACSLCPQELFRAGLRSSYVLTQALRRGAAGEPLVAALLSTMTQVNSRPNGSAGWACGDACCSSFLLSGCCKVNPLWSNSDDS